MEHDDLADAGRQHLGSLAGEGTAAIAGLPAGEFPHLTATARHARHLGPDGGVPRAVLRGPGAGGA
ncbi:hypothetical protein [Actinomadura madurae]|uniref:hypothetical protein n=1 Tax=Actinomadura madurae TaxID=1993 RepID=UPI0020D243EF|nr:hypothetical protein [Actinomadura madurae]MCP9985041.1 hypothetical protein [Actinomadura madurae]